MSLRWTAVLYQYLFGLTVCLTSMATGAWITWPSIVNPMLLNGSAGFRLASNEITTMVALMDLGNVLSPYPVTYIMDSFGRKFTALLCSVILTLASLLVVVFRNTPTLFLARFFSGLGKGVGYTVMPIYLAEMASADIRGGLSGLFVSSLTFGSFLLNAIGPYMTYASLNIFLLVVSLASFSVIFFPESPYFLLIRKKEAEARFSLMKLRKMSVDNDILNNELESVKKRVEMEMSNRGRFIDLFSTSGARKGLAIACLLAFFQRTCGYLQILAFGSLMIRQEGGGLSLATYLMIFSFLSWIGSCVVLYFVDSFGRKPLLFLSGVLTAVVDLIFAVYFLLDAREVDLSSVQWLPYACLVAFSVASLGLCAVPSIVIGELFPANIRSYACCVSAMVYALVSFSTNELFNVNSIPYIFCFFVVSCVCSAYFSKIYLFETKGKSLGEIQDVLNKSAS